MPPTIINQNALDKIVFVKSNTLCIICEGIHSILFCGFSDLSFRFCKLEII